MAWNTQGQTGNQNVNNPFQRTGLSPFSDEYKQQHMREIAASNGVPQQGQYAISQANKIRGYSDLPVDLGNSGWWNEGDTSKRDDYNRAVDAINKSGRINEGESFNQIDRATTIPWFDGNPENASYRGSYATGNSSYANAFNDYLKSGNNWSTFSNNMGNAYKNALDRQSTDAFNTWKDQYMNMDFSGLVDARNQELYDNAKSKIDRDYARGYLNNTGYQSALNALNADMPTNRDMLDMESTALQDKWNTDARQLISQNMPTSDWVSNYNNLKRDTWDMTNAWDALNKYSQGVNEDFFKAGLLSNVYNPKTYVATGASNQGFYNPYESIARDRKRKLYDSIGEY